MSKSDTESSLKVALKGAHFDIWDLLEKEVVIDKTDPREGLSSKHTPRTEQEMV